MNIWLKSPNNDKPSVSLTLLVATFVIGMVKLLFSDVHVGAFVMSTFTAGDFGVLITPVAALYFGRNFNNSKKADEGTPE